MRPWDESYWDCPLCQAPQLLEIPDCDDTTDRACPDRACAGCGLALFVDPPLRHVWSVAVPDAA
jgi:hypothetical protein